MQLHQIDDPNEDLGVYLQNLHDVADLQHLIKKVTSEAGKDISKSLLRLLAEDPSLLNVF